MIEKSRDVTSKAWFALYTKSRSEFKAAEQISANKVEYYLPTVVKYRQWSDRKKKITEPLIRGYIFVYANEKERIISLEQNAVVRCLTERGQPAKIPDWQIENLKNMLRNEADFYIAEGFVPGAKVRIKEGPFENVIGVVQEVDGGRTLAVSIDLLNRSVIAHLPKESILEIIK
ncbi:MAG: UpxY family transcription antiterminator [Ignavibacteriaceae bacterium]